MSLQVGGAKDLPVEVVAAGEFQNTNSAGELVYQCMLNGTVPLTGSLVYLTDKTLVGKISEVFGTAMETFFTVKPQTAGAGETLPAKHKGFIWSYATISANLALQAQAAKPTTAEEMQAVLRDIKAERKYGICCEYLALDTPKLRSARLPELLKLLITRTCTTGEDEANRYFFRHNRTDENFAELPAMELTRSEAIKTITDFLHKDLPYVFELMPREKARELAERYVMTAGPDATFWCNWTEHACYPVADSPFDKGVMALSPSMLSFVWVGDEDRSLLEEGVPRLLMACGGYFD